MVDKQGAFRRKKELSRTAFILAFILLEILMHDSLTQFIEKHSLLSKCQFELRKMRS